MNKRRMFFVLISLVFLISFLSFTNNVKADTKRTNDGCLVTIYYIDPTLPSIDPYTGRISQQAQVGLYENMKLEYQIIIVDFDYYIVTNRNMSVTIEYFDILVNETTNNEYFVPSFNETKEFVLEDDDHITMTYELREDEEWTFVLITYRNVFFGFYHQTNPAFQGTFIDNLSLNVKILLYVAIAVVVGLLAVFLAGWIVKKAQIFDFSMDIMLMLFMIGLLGLFGYMTFYRYISLSMLLYKIPRYVFFLIEFLLVFSVAVNIMNRDEIVWKLTDWRPGEGGVDKPFYIPTNIGCTAYLQRGFMAGLSRFFGTDPEGTIKFGEFVPAKKELKTETMPKEDFSLLKSKRSAVKKLRKDYPKAFYDISVEQKEETVDFTIFTKYKKFVENEKNPRWSIKSEVHQGSVYNVVNEYVVTDYQVQHGYFEKSNAWISVFGITFGFSLLVQFLLLNNVPWEDIWIDIIKGATWIICVLIAFMVIGKQRTPAEVHMEILPKEVAFEMKDGVKGLMIDHELKISMAYMDRLKKKSLALVLANDEIFNLQTDIHQHIDAGVVEGVKTRILAYRKGKIIATAQNMVALKKLAKESLDEEDDVDEED